MARKLRLALDMYEFGERMARSTLRRRHLRATGEQIEQMLGDWLQARPGAPVGDTGGGHPAGSNER